MQGSWDHGPMLRSRSRWQNWLPTYGSERKRNDRAHENRQWRAPSREKGDIMANRWVQINGKGKWHLSMTSMDVEGAGDTVCGQFGHLRPGEPGFEPDRKDKHAECRKFDEGS